MKQLSLFIVLVHTSVVSYCQYMQMKNINFSSFVKTEKHVTSTLNQLSSNTAKQHPEYGILPYNAQCNTCVEIIDKRTETTRFYVDADKKGITYSQSSYFPLHYKVGPNQIWKTIDPRLSPDVSIAGLYSAPNQPVPTYFNTNTKSTTLGLPGFMFEYNQNVSMYFVDSDIVSTASTPVNYANLTVGSGGAYARNAWPGIDMQHQYGKGEIETNYIITSPQQLPSAKGWLVFEDHFTLPDGYSIAPQTADSIHKNGLITDNLLIKNADRNVLAIIEKPVYVDSRAFGMHGFYEIINDYNNYTLRTLVPASWLTDASNTYPLFIDPRVSGVSKLGNFSYTNLSSASLGFTSENLGTCNTGVAVTVPGKSRLIDALVDLEYQLTFDNSCGSPPLPAPFCTASQATEEVVSNECATTSGRLGCASYISSQNGFYITTGTCTTDPNLVANAHSISLIGIDSNFLSCVAPQCPDYDLHFTLKNRDSICGDVCGYLCARSNIFQMTVEAETIEGTFNMDTTPVCPGTPVTATAFPKYGVPPYHFQWSTNGGSTYQSAIYGNPNFTFSPQQSTMIVCKFFDSCNIEYDVPNYLIINTIPTSTITQMGDTLISPYADGNQWYFNDSLLPGDTLQQHIATQTGTYYFKSIYDSCESYSVFINLSGIVDIRDDRYQLSIIPNPSKGDFVVRLTSAENAAITLKLLDATGRLIEVRNESVIQGVNNYSLNAHQKLASGVYWVELNTGKTALKQKVLITE